MPWRDRGAGRRGFFSPVKRCGCPAGVSAPLPPLPVLANGCEPGVSGKAGLYAVPGIGLGQVALLLPAM